nr:DJ-1/PfpI family protein [Deinobacterium chartae]
MVYPGFSEFEVTIALTLLAPKYRVVNVGLTLEPVVGEAGLQVLPQVTLEQGFPEDAVALLIPGCPDLSVLLHAEALFERVRTLHARGTLLAAICAGPYVLARAGVLEGRDYTVTLARPQREFLGVFDASRYRYQDVITDGHLITAQGHAFAAFGLEVARHLGAARNLEGVRTFYSGLGNPLFEEAERGSLPEAVR